VRRTPAATPPGSKCPQRDNALRATCCDPFGVEMPASFDQIRKTDQAWNDPGGVTACRIRMPHATTTRRTAGRSRCSALGIAAESPEPLRRGLAADSPTARRIWMRRNAPTSYTLTVSIAFRTAPSIFPSIASSSSAVHVTRMLKLMRRLMTASLLGKVRVLRSCGRPSSWATSL